MILPLCKLGSFTLEELLLMLTLLLTGALTGLTRLTALGFLGAAFLAAFFAFCLHPQFIWLYSRQIFYVIEVVQNETVQTHEEVVEIRSGESP